MEWRPALSSILDPAIASELEQRVKEANDSLARAKAVPAEVERLVASLSKEVVDLFGSERSGVDPYLILALQQGLIAALRALDQSSVTEKRRQLRVALEKMRQALRDVVEGADVAADVPAKEVLRWLVDILDVPQAVVADILDVTPRTLHRWLSPADPSAPHDEDALRIHLLAKMSNHLRHGFSGPGVVAWLERPHPELKGRAPKDLLTKRQTFEQLTHLAAAARSSAAS